MTAIVCYARCWSCTAGQCFDPSKAHTWMDDDDREHALNTGQITEETDLAKERRCGCSCAVEPSPVLPGQIELPVEPS